MKKSSPNAPSDQESRPQQNGAQPNNKPISEQEIAKGLERNIQASILCCDKLLEMLKEERESLKSRNFDNLDDLIAKKTGALQQLEQCAIQRSQWVQANRDNSDAMVSFTRWAKRNNLSSEWEKLQALLKECRHSNEVNGKFMLRNQATHKKLLDILRGSPTGNPLYTGKGVKNQTGSGNTLGEA